MGRGSGPGRYPSPLRYPGGKGKLANFLKALFLDNDLVGSEYVEVYAGGASVALTLLFEEYASHVHINDISPSIHAFWNCVLTDHEALCRRIESTGVTTDEWQRQRAIQLSPTSNELDLGFSTFFLNRTSRSGILGGGLIGGRDQAGPWKLDARYNKEELIRRIKKIARFANRITLTCKDAADYIRTVVPLLPESFVYLDPPYFEKGQRLYENYYLSADHAEIASLVQGMEVAGWMVSYDAMPEVIALYDCFQRVSYTLNYSAAERYAGAEVMFFSPGLSVPLDSLPTALGPDDIAARRIQARDERVALGGNAVGPT